MKIINAWWSKRPLPGNFGDILTPIIMNKIFDAQCRFVNIPFEEEDVLMAIGSTIRFVNEKSVVWGSGIMFADDDIDINARFLSVRGPRTYERLKELGADVKPVFGDPALLLPEIYKLPKIARKPYKYGLFAHYVDMPLIFDWYKKEGNSIKILNPINPHPMNLVREVVKCERIISSSLHGLIVAHAYGIPAIWVKHSDKLHGDDSKFYDYFETVDIDTKPMEFMERIDIKKFDKFDYTVGSEFDKTELMKTMQEYLDER